MMAMLQVTDGRTVNVYNKGQCVHYTAHGELEMLCDLCKKKKCVLGDGFSLVHSNIFLIILSGKIKVM